jgi:uncharacterized membrane protein YfcA
MWVRQYGRLVLQLWWALVIGGVLGIVALIALIKGAHEGWLVWACLALLFVILAQVLVARGLIRRSTASQAPQVIHNYFAPGSNPTFSVPASAVPPPIPPTEPGTENDA